MYMPKSMFRYSSISIGNVTNSPAAFSLETNFLSPIDLVFNVSTSVIINEGNRINARNKYKFDASLPYLLMLSSS